MLREFNYTSQQGSTIYLVLAMAHNTHLNSPPIGTRISITRTANAIDLAGQCSRYADHGHVVTVEFHTNVAALTSCEEQASASSLNGDLSIV